jgi:hypothetical protein
MSQGHDISFYSDLLARHQYALVDRAFASQETLEEIPTFPLVPRPLKVAADEMPVLVPLNPKAPHMAFLADCMKKGESDTSENPVDTLIAVSPDVKQQLLERHLISRLIVKSPQGEAYMRYYSSDVFPHLVRILSPARLKSLFGHDGGIYGAAVQHWTYRFQNEWITVDAPVTEDVAPTSWIITREQRESLDHVGELSKALDTYRDNMDRPWKDHVEWNEKACIAERSMGIAKRTYHLSAPTDLVAFAVQALTHGERFYNHPRIHNLLQETASRPCAYRDATIAITDEEWATMNAGHSLQSNF